MSLVSQPGGQKCEAFTDILRVGVDEGVGGNDSKLDKKDSTKKPATGKAIKLRLACS